jgi:methionyl-tRNA formyltransferase
MKIVFFGSSRHMLPTLQMLAANYDLSLVVTTEKNSEDAVPSYCRKNNIPYLSVRNLKDEAVREKIIQARAEIGILGYFGSIVPQSVLDIFPKGIINIHPSLLPKYRGPTPVQTALLNGDQETGTTIILLDNEVDHGPVLAHQEVSITPADTTDSLHTKLFSLGAELIKEVLPRYISGELKPSKQDHDKATFTKHLNKIDGQIDLNNPPPKDKLNRMIRAYFPWPGVWTILRTKNKELRTKFLPGQKLQVEGGKPMSVKDFINGYPNLDEKYIKIITAV